MKKILVLLTLISSVSVGSIIAMQKETDQITLVGKDGTSFEIARETAEKIPTLQTMLESGLQEAQTGVFIFKLFDAAALQSVVDFVEHVYTQAPVFKLDPQFFEQTDKHQAYTPADIPQQVRNMIQKQGLQNNQQFMRVADFLGLDWVESAMQGGFSIADLIVYNKVPQVQNNVLELTSKNIVSLAGISLLPEQILSTLQLLYLNQNQITTIPDAIDRLTNLRALYLENNQITTIPDAIGRLTNLQSLFLDNNQITTISDAIGNLTNLQGLILSNNQISSIPDAIGNLTNLLRLSLNNNHITVIPDAIGNLTNLLSLYLSDNQITTIPDAIGNLTSLNYLNLENNQITTIPDAIGNLTNLQLLYLDNNQITKIPDAIGSLTELLKLDLSNNQLTQEAKDRIRQLLPGVDIEF